MKQSAEREGKRVRETASIKKMNGKTNRTQKKKNTPHKRSKNRNEKREREKRKMKVGESESALTFSK